MKSLILVISLQKFQFCLPLQESGEFESSSYFKLCYLGFMRLNGGLNSLGGDLLVFLNIPLLIIVDFCFLKLQTTKIHLLKGLIIGQSCDLVWGFFISQVLLAMDIYLEIFIKILCLYQAKGVLSRISNDKYPFEICNIDCQC